MNFGKDIHITAIVRIFVISILVWNLTNLWTFFRQQGGQNVSGFFFFLFFFCFWTTNLHDDYFSRSCMSGTSIDPALGFLPACVFVYNCKLSSFLGISRGDIGSQRAGLQSGCVQRGGRYSQDMRKSRLNLLSLCTWYYYGGLNNGYVLQMLILTVTCNTLKSCELIWTV